MGTLRALLVGIPSEDLAFTAADTARLKEALIASGYAPADVTVADTAARTSYVGLHAELNTFLAGCHDGDFALVYVSGHGLRADGVDYLVPSGHNPAAGVAGLVAVRPETLLAQLTSTATVMLCLDTCRDEAGAGPDAGPVPPVLTAVRENVLLVHACAPGRRAMGTAAGSFLGRALAEALGPDSPPRTVVDVLAGARARARQIAADHGVRAQVEAWWLGGTAEHPPPGHARREICRSGPGRESWSEALHEAALWDRVAPGAMDDRTLGEVKDLLTRLAERVLAVRRDAARPEKAGPDPWDDPRVPLRVLHQLDRLVPPATECRLSPLEAATLLAAPFVREAAVACGRRALAELYLPEGPALEPPATTAEPGGAAEQAVRGTAATSGGRAPGDTGGRQENGTAAASGPGGDPGVVAAGDPAVGAAGGGQGGPVPARRVDAKEHMAEDMADVRKAFGQIDAKRQRLLAAGDLDAARAAEQWLRHRLLDGWDELWDGCRDGARPAPAVNALHSLPDVLDLLTDGAALAVGLGSVSRPHSRARLRTAVLQVVAQMRTRPADTAPSGEPWQAGLARQLGVGPAMLWRPQALAELLHMAELLAVDPRSLDGIVVDHLGVRHHEVSPAALVAQVADSEFGPVDHGPGPAAVSRAADWTLVAECGNAALHVALERRTETAAGTARNIAKARPDDVLLTALPRHINTDALEPARDGAAYESPPPRFQLAEDGVQPLIMGTQLYGDRMLAVRELYQNALDACRRRHARQRYAALTAPPGAEPAAVRELADYTVTLTLGSDASGRLYIECRDDGIGMTAEELRDLFARAGRRNEQSPARVREMRRWRRAGIVPELNSRFGIGVFSYFMLAEEIRVTTRPAGTKGQGAAGPGHRVDVVADSGLMHISSEEDGEVGTRVRLYVRPEFGAGRPNLVGFVDGNILYSPVRLVVEEERRPRHTVTVQRPAGVLRFDGQLVPATPGQERSVWWVNGQGARLVDGILVKRDKPPHGYVVNLRRRHRPVISASRNELNGFATDVVYRELGGAAEELAREHGLPMAWLRQLVEDDARLAVVVIDRLLSEGTKVALDQEYARSPGRPATLRPLAAVGCFPLDSAMAGPFGLRNDVLSGREFFLHWRLLMTVPDQPSGTAIEFPAGFPRPSGLDALLFRWDTGHGWSPGPAVIGAAARSGLNLRVIVRALRRYAVTGVPVPAVDDIRALARIPHVHLMVDLCLAYAKAGHLWHMEARLGFRTAQPHPIRHMPLLEQAARPGRPLGDVTLLVRLLRLVAPDIPEPPSPGDLAQHAMTVPEEVVLFSAKGGPPLLPRHVTPLAAAYVAAQLGLRAADVTAVARRFARYGYEVTESGSAPDLTPDELAFLDTRPYEAVPWLGTGGIDARRLIWLAARNTEDDCGVAATAARAADLARRFGLTMRLDEAERAALFPLRAPSWWGWLPQDEDGPSAAPYGAWTVLVAASSDPDARVDLSDVQALVDAGIAHAAAVDAVRERFQESADKPPYWLRKNYRRPYSTAAAERDNWSGRARFRQSSSTVDAAFLFAAAADMKFELDMMRRMLRGEAATPSIRFAHLPEECRRLQPDPEVFKALCFTGTSVWRPEITLGGVAEYARAAELDLATAAARLRAYEPLGAPTVPGDAAMGCEPFEARDPAVERLFRFEPLADGRLTPLALVITAVRLDLGLRSAYAALAPYERLGLELACPEPADDAHAPDWRDVVILTRQLTGAEPALAGAVDADHIELAEEETDLTAAQVRDRLAYYAPMFGLTLPVAEPGPGIASVSVASTAATASTASTAFEGTADAGA